MGRKIWAVFTASEAEDGMRIPASIGGPYRVLSFRQFLPADPPHRQKHMVQLWTDPGGMRTLNVGCLRLKDPGKADAMRARHERGDFDPQPTEDDDD